MDAFRIGATAAEGEVTEMMVAEQTCTGAHFTMTERADRSVRRRDSKSVLSRMLLGTDGGTAAGGAGSLAGSRPQSSAFAAATANDGGGTDDDADEITSDDSGDFGALTDGLEDAADYDLVRALIAFDKQQERELEALQRECEQLEGEQNVLWRRAVTAEQARQRNGKQHRRRLYGQGGKDGDDRAPLPCGAPRGAHSADNARATPTPAEEWRWTAAHAHDEVIDEDVDEFEDVWLNTGRACRYLDPESSYHQREQFRYAEPDHPGDFATVFDQGFLFRTVTPEGAWVFFNDSEKYMMNVKYRFGATSTVAAGPKAALTRLASGEIEVEVAVAPEETQILIFGEVNGFRSLSVALPVPEDFVNARVEAHNAPAAAALAALAVTAKVASIKHLAPEDALRVCRQQEDGAQPFIDPDFPPCSSSLCRKGRDVNFLWSEPWRRPSGYMAAADADEARLFRGQVLPYDPGHGDGGDVYLCSAAAILAEYPMLVRALFRHPLQHLAVPEGPPGSSSPGELARLAANEAKAERRVHAYRVTVNHGGWWTSTLLDDFLPASRKGPVFARCEDDLRKLWFPLLQKAYAKAHGSYAAIQCGDVAEALQDLTGFPTSRFDEEWAAATNDTATERNRVDLFDLLRGHLKSRGYAVCVSLPDEGPEQGKAAAMGLTYGMSYYVMDMVAYKSFDAGLTYRLVQLRCPTVKPGWDGRWCPDSIRWREEDRELGRLCGVGDGAASTAADGVWLDWSAEVLDMFEGGAICHTCFGKHDYRVRGEFNDGVPSVALEVTVAAAASPVEMYCVLSQMDDRAGDPENAASALSPLMLCVSRPAPLLRPALASSVASGRSSRRSEDSARGRRDSVAGGGGSSTTAAAPARRRHVVESVCGTDPDEPSEKLSFIVGRDVTVRYTFAPQSEEDKADALAASGGDEDEQTEDATDAFVYYIIPRARGAMQGKPFTIGLLSSAPIDNDAVKVRFVKPDDKCEVFRNRREFCPERMSTPAESVNFQIRDHMGRVTSAWGPCIAKP